MFEAFVEKINKLNDPEQIEVGDYTHVKEGYKRFTPPFVSQIYVHTLQGFADMVTEIKVEEKLIVVVDSPEEIRLYGDIDPKHKTRQLYCFANLNREQPQMVWRNTEDFNIFLQSNFEDTDDKAKILELIGNLSDEMINNYSDDGMTQKVTKKVGISRKENAEVPNPVILAPYRTFIDISQPESTFILRMRSESVPQCNLFLADGELWKVKAINLIKAFLSEKIKDIPIIG